jgi:hypothetical protein
VVKKKKAKRLAAEIADYLFKSAAGPLAATRLVQEFPRAKLEGSGYCRGAVIDTIVNHLRKKNLRPSKATGGGAA